jgi:rhodanese-related sulfurtransferase
MRSRVGQALVLIFISVILAFGANTFSGRGIPLKGNWPSISGSDSVIVPPSAEAGDPPFISLDEAAAKFQSPGILIIDARDSADYDAGHIKGAVNLPFDYMDDYWNKVMAGVDKKREIVIYCSGEECELSLMLGREMAGRGYSRISIFYGGWREWERAKLPIEKGA